METNTHHKASKFIQPHTGLVYFVIRYVFLCIYVVYLFFIWQICISYNRLTGIWHYYMKYSRKWTIKYPEILPYHNPYPTTCIWSVFCGYTKYCFGMQSMTGYSLKLNDVLGGGKELYSVFNSTFYLSYCEVSVNLICVNN